jgi:hypothetical protein
MQCAAEEELLQRARTTGSAPAEEMVRSCSADLEGHGAAGSKIPSLGGRASLKYKKVASANN